MKTCVRCLETKPVLEFHKNKAASDGHQRLCKECHALKNAEWLKANHETESPKRNEYRRAYYVKNKEQELVKLHAYYRQNYDKYYEKMVWRSRRVRKATPPWADREKIKAIYKEAASMRSKGLDVSVDHVIPIAGKLVCGLHVHSNLEIIKSADNKSKSNKFATI